MPDTEISSKTLVLPRWRIGAMAALGVGGLVIGTMALLNWAGGFLIDADAIMILVASLGFFGMLALATSYSRERGRQTQWPVFLIWWGLLVSEEVFSYRSNLTSVSGAEFASQAYAQGILWLVALAGLLITLLKFPQPLRGLFQGDYKWMAWLTVVSILSSLYAPNPAFSLAWGFKLGLVVLVLHLCSRQMSEPEDICKFLNTTVLAFVFLTVLPTFRSLFESDPLGEYGTHELEQRFREAPTGISSLAGLLLILCLTIYSPRKRKWPLAIAALAFIIMLTAGGKTGIVAGFLCGILFYALQKRFKAILGFGAIAILGFVLAVRFTPLGQYFDNYLRLEQFSSFSGRTGLWTFVMPLVLEKPILGHGFNASRFVAVLYPNTPFSSTHMHNSLLEAVYNNGLVGLVLLLMVLVVIARNLWRTVHSAQNEVRYLAIGCSAAFANLFVNGMFNASFGGRPDASYMMLIALLVISSQLWRLAKESLQQNLPSPMQWSPSLELRTPSVS